jgi:hypothetical protein
MICGHASRVTPRRRLGLSVRLAMKNAKAALPGALFGTISATWRNATKRKGCDSGLVSCHRIENAQEIAAADLSDLIRSEAGL